MTTTDLIKILSDNEYGAISHKPRNISLTINGKYMPEPRIALSSTGDGIAGPEIDLDIDGEFFEECEECELTDADTDKYAVQVQNGEGYYNSDGKYVPYDLD